MNTAERWKQKLGDSLYCNFLISSAVKSKTALDQYVRFARFKRSKLDYYTKNLFSLKVKVKIRSPTQQQSAYCLVGENTRFDSTINIQWVLGLTDTLCSVRKTERPLDWAPSMWATLNTADNFEQLNISMMESKPIIILS